MAMKVIPEIVEQHAEEAAFLWLLRDRAVRAPHYSLKDLADLDERVEAHIDGLRIAGEAGWERCRDALEHEESGEGFAAAVLAFESGEEKRVRAVLDAASASEGVARGVISGFGWVSFDRAQRQMDTLLTSESPALRRVGIAAWAIHRQDPSRVLNRALADEELPLRARALRAVGELGRVDLLAQIRAELQSDDESCRFFAARSAAIQGDRGTAAPALCALAEGAGPWATEACNLAVRCMTVASARSWLRNLASKPETHRLGVVGSGALGDPAVVPWLIDRMSDPEIARVAGEAFSTITGAHLVEEKLEDEPPADFEAGPSENPEDESVEMDPDEDLPWPHKKTVIEWYRARQSQFQGGTRYLLGKPIARGQLVHVLRHGLQRQRAAAALELAMAKPGQILFEVRAPGRRQQQFLKVGGA